jgi:hypothetical protein
MSCEYYFEMYHVPEQYKTCMVVIHFSKEMNGWYRTLMVGNQSSPWDLLLGEVNARFKLAANTHSLEEFKRLH